MCLSKGAPVRDSSYNCGADEGGLTLVVGAVTSPDTTRVSRLMRSLADRIGRRDDAALKVVLLENGGRDGASRAALRNAVARAVRQGLDVDLITLERQAADAAAGAFPSDGAQLTERKSIALSRTMLQRYLFLEAKPCPGAVAWILDDDVVLEGLGYGPDSSLQVQDADYVSAIKRPEADRRRRSPVPGDGRPAAAVPELCSHSVG